MVFFFLKHEDGNKNFFFFSSRRRHTRSKRDWSSDVCSSDLGPLAEEPNYLAHAFKSQYNLIGLGTAIGFAVLSSSALPLLLAAGIQLAVLPLVAGSDRFQRLVRARRLEEERGERQDKQHAEASAMFRALSEPERVRYRGLETLATEIRQNYKGLDASSQALLDELVQKLEFLQAFYLRMRYSVARYEAYFQTTDPERLRERLAMLEHEMKEGPERVRDMEDILSAEQDLLLPGNLGDDIEAELGGLGVAREAARQAPPPVNLPNPPVAP